MLRLRRDNRRSGLIVRTYRAMIGVPSGLHPGATPASPGVQKSLILRGFLEAVLLWRRGKGFPPPLCLATISILPNYQRAGPAPTYRDDSSRRSTVISREPRRGRKTGCPRRDIGHQRALA